MPTRLEHIMPQNLPIVLFQHSHESPQLFPRNPPIMLVLKIYDIVTNIHFNACYIVTLELKIYDIVTNIHFNACYIVTVELKIHDIVTNIHFNACYIVTLELFQYNPVVLVPGGQ